MSLAVDKNLTNTRAVFASDYIQQLDEHHFENEIQNELIRFFDADAKVRNANSSMKEY